jgi:hypothetical protein
LDERGREQQEDAENIIMTSFVKYMLSGGQRNE